MMSNLLNWFSENANVKVSKALSIEKSFSDGFSSGSGLFVDLTLIDYNPKGETIELLRIPRMTTFSLDTLLELIKDEKQYSSKENMERLHAKIRVVFSQFLELDELKDSMSETIVLVFYFTFLTLVKNDYEIPRILAFYLENVLLQVEVENAVMFYDQTVDLYGQYSTFAGMGDVMASLENFFSGKVSDSSSVFPLLKRIYAAILSRCLEIPEEIDENSDDFVVNTTLVPLLDFANHSNDMKNAHFDVDRRTKDVLLLLDLNRMPVDVPKFEVFISYSPNEDLFSFIYYYGFVPTAIKEYQLMNISFDRDYLKEQEPLHNVNLRLFYKWMRINPVVQLVKFRDCWYLNDATKEFAYFLLAFMHSFDNKMTSCWTYDPACCRTFWYFQQHSKKAKQNHLSMRAYKEKIALLEKDDSDWIGLPQLAWTLTFQGEDLNPHRGRFSKEHALELAPFDNERIFDDAIDLFSKFFIDYIKWRLSKLEALEPRFSSSVLSRLVGLEKTVLRQLLHEPHLYYWSDQQADLVGYESNLCPLLDKSHRGMDSGALEEALSLENLSLKEYRPEEYTDYLQEELELYANLV